MKRAGIAGVPAVVAAPAAVRWRLAHSFTLKTERVIIGSMPRAQAVGDAG